MLEIINLLLEELDSDNSHMPPTVLYNEGWLLRLILWWFSQNQIKDSPLSFCDGADWYSEGLLTTPFLPVCRGDELAESYTHADGIIGNITVGGVGRTAIKLIDPCEQFIVLEAKLFSRLSGSTKRAPGYNQVARNIACMASVAERSSCSVEGFQSLCFHVLAPEAQIEKEAYFEKYVQKDAVCQVVRQRVEAYKGRPDYVEKQKWFEEYFEPLLSKIEVSLISWEIIIDSIGGYDKKTGEKLLKFYDLCCGQ